MLLNQCRSRAGAANAKQARQNNVYNERRVLAREYDNE